MDDLYAQGEPLSPDGLFQLVAQEAFKDGILEEKERKIINRVASFLKLEDGRARQIVALAKDKYEKGELGKERPLKPKTLYRQVLWYVASDGKIDALEAAMLSGLRKMLRISDGDHLRILAEVRPHGGRQAAGPPTD